MNKKKTLAGIVLSSFLLNGCAVKGINKNYNGPSFKKQEILDKYECACPKNYPHSIYDCTYFKEPEQSITAKNENYEVIDLKFDSPVFTYEDNKEVVIEYYKVKDEHKTHPLIILSPISGGNYGIERRLARYFANNDFSCALMHRQKHKYELGAAGMENILKQMVINYDQAIDWFGSVPEVDDSKGFCSVGISMGGIKNAILAGLDERLKYNVFIFAGSTDEILLKTKEKGIQKLKQKALEEGMDLKEFIEDVTGPETTQPQHFAKYIDAKNSLMITASFDRIIPKSASKKLRNEMGNPKTIYLAGGHISSILYLPYIKKKCLKFFNERLNEEKVAED